MAKLVYAIEGLDRLGKSTLIDNIQQLGFYQVIHFGKPQRLKVYEGAMTDLGHPETSDLKVYQHTSFRNSMILAKSGARLIFDRWHLGEAVYAPLYRKYDGDYVFSIEQRLRMGDVSNLRLILLVEDFSCSQHFQSDGESFDDTKREREQELFIAAFNKSIIRDKRMICVTDPTNGQFRDPQEILKEAIE